ncbi:MAG: hypothetical protein EOM12_08610 [Verrucomicrobiae bacterium]|nr:hypothetical protein [Verrucomicrobiae bacterium]
MLKKDEEALICDFAETYHIYDFKRLPLTTVAALAVGLRDSSRIKMLLNDAPASADIMLLAAIVDRLSLLVWFQTKDGEKGHNRPKSILGAISPKESNVSAFESGEDFIKERERLLHPSEEVE